MISLAILVLLTTLLSYFLNTLAPDLFNDTVWAIYTYLPTSADLRPLLQEHTTLKHDVLKLRHEIRSTSAQDHFAKWAKAKRKHDEKVSRLEVVTNAIATQKSGFRTKARIVRWIITTGLRLAVQAWCIKKPVVWLPAMWVEESAGAGEWVLWALALPRAPRGSVSVQVWGMACAVAVDLVVGKVLVMLVRKGMGMMAARSRSRGKMAVGVGDDGKKEK